MNAVAISCPACGTAVPDAATKCPKCHLAVSLFDSIVEAAGARDGDDPSYVRTIGEILAAVDLQAPAARGRSSAGLLSRPGRYLTGSTPAPAPNLTPTSSSLVDHPALPAPTPLPVLKRNIEEYLRLGRTLGRDLSDFRERADAALPTEDRTALETLRREMFVELTAAMTAEYDAVQARRNEVVQFVATPSPDVELEACRTALAQGDLVGASRRLRLTSEELNQLQEEWEVVQILSTEADLLVETIREFGGDPGPALGPLSAGRQLAKEGWREEAEHVLARTTVALWSILQPAFMGALHRLKDQMLEARGAGGDVEPAVVVLRQIAEELRRRNFVGTITTYRRLKGLLERPAAGAETAPVPEGEPLSIERPQP